MKLLLNCMLLQGTVSSFPTMGIEPVVHCKCLPEYNICMANLIFYYIVLFFVMTFVAPLPQNFTEILSPMSVMGIYKQSYNI